MGHVCAGQLAPRVALSLLRLLPLGPGRAEALGRALLPSGGQWLREDAVGGWGGGGRGRAGAELGDCRARGGSCFSSLCEGFFFLLTRGTSNLCRTLLVSRAEEGQAGDAPLPRVPNGAAGSRRG